MSDNPQQPNNDQSRPMPPNYSPQSGSQPPAGSQQQYGSQQQGSQPGYGSQQQNPQYGSQQAYGSQQQYGSQQAYGGQQAPGSGQPYGSQQSYGQPGGYGAGPVGASSAFGPAASVPMGAELPPAAYGPGSVGFWNADQTERTTALWSHLAHAATYVIGLGWIVTLILFIINKDKSPYLRHHGAQSLNLLIVGVIAAFGIGLIGGILTIVGIGFLILLLLPVLTIYMIVIEIIAGLAANRGEGYRIPMTPNWIK
ncbi:DUF4870 domain-containing protein [Brevibacterium spongiae]|uniref:DUF4870 domain-containing protein n=1 Tax=Brevibacterium spongiae TaxID=2909672 RepID=A0ABY5SMZ6_9MICO|nr:DUF4870 domain-containing protein [Brevibacterium spongiae]UVI34546.1 DUF4870 domain-containing protein [Brevibacterium spongiae]